MVCISLSSLTGLVRLRLGGLFPPLFLPILQRFFCSCRRGELTVVAADLKGRFSDSAAARCNIAIPTYAAGLDGEDGAAELVRERGQQLYPGAGGAR